MAISATDLQEIRDGALAALKTGGVYSYTTSTGISVTRRTQKELRETVEWCDQQLARSAAGATKRTYGEVVW